MRNFGLLTGAIGLVLAALAIALPKPPSYMPGVDDDPPRLFTTIESAERAVGFDIPDAGLPAGWELEGVTVTGAWYGQRVLAEHPEARYRPLPNQDPATRRPPITWNTLPEPHPGMRHFITVAYRSEHDIFITLTINSSLSPRYPVIPSSDTSKVKKQPVRLGGHNATLLRYTAAQQLDIMSTAWRVRGLAIQATGVNPGPLSSYMFTADEFIAFLANVR